MQRARLVAIELHEDQIPDLDVAIAVGIRRSRRPTGDTGTMVPEHLRAGTTRTGVAHLPEVVALEFRAARLVSDTNHALARNLDVPGPHVVGLVVRLVDRNPHPVRIQSVLFGQEIPGEDDRVALEIVAEAEVAQHLEESVVARRIAYVLQVVVLAACAQAALSRRGAHIGALVESEEHVLELHHAGVGEQERGIVGRHERTGRHDGVAVAFEVLQEPRPNFTAFHR